MADVKWIKITTDIFDDDKIKIIDRMPARDEILVIWFKLLALAGKVNEGGLLFLNNRIAYTTDMLSAVFNREENTVKMAFTIFQKYGMIHIEDNDVIAITNWEKHQNVDGLDKMRKQNALRQKEHRERQKLLSCCNVISNVTSHQSNATDIELELDIEQDKKKEKKPKELKTFLSDSYEYRLSKLLHDRILLNNPEVKQPDIQAWSRTIDLMIRIDKRDPQIIAKVIDFCQKDSFWRSNILSTKKLREKFDQLALKMKTGTSNGKIVKGSTEDLQATYNSDVVQNFLRKDDI